MNIKQTIKRLPGCKQIIELLHPLIDTTRRFNRDIKLFFKTKRMLNCVKKDEPHIFYIGIPAHANLGDLAQGVCIRKWLKKHYSQYKVIEIETNALVNTRFSLLIQLKRVVQKNDIIVFQSGYTTTDLGGYADEMHRAVMEILPKTRMLMMPQTIYFLNKENERRTSLCYNKMEKMLFLARDSVSYQMALSMFPDIPVLAYPDIVTTMIGNFHFDYDRNGILFCCRNDSEKYYSDDELDVLIMKCRSFAKVDKTDTTKIGDVQEIVNNAEKHIMTEVNQYAHYKVIITDRYHGTILSLVAGTPVIIIKTTDHKVITGAQWFAGVYDDYVFLADSLVQAYDMAKKLYSRNLTYKLLPYFEREYYDKLPSIFAELVR